MWSVSSGPSLNPAKCYVMNIFTTSKLNDVFNNMMKNEDTTHVITDDSGSDVLLMASAGMSNSML